MVGAETKMYNVLDVQRAGDIMRPKNSRYPYAVRSKIIRGNGNSISVPVNRGIIADQTLTNQGIYVGKNCSYRMIATTLPTLGVTGTAE